MSKLRDLLSYITSLFRMEMTEPGSISDGVRSKMHLVSDDEVTVWFQQNGVCPDCGEASFIPGPRGGLAQNMTCSGCGSEFNIARCDGRIFMASRIDRSSYSGKIVTVPAPDPPRILH